MSTLQNHSIPSLPNLHLRGHFEKISSLFSTAFAQYHRYYPADLYTTNSTFNNSIGIVVNLQRERERDNWNFFWFSSGFSFLSIVGKILSDSLCLDNTHFGKKEIMESDWSINNPNGPVNCSLTRKWEAKWQRGIFRSFPERTSRTVL